ncbi:hypothetical protein [Chryseobacterium sp. MMS23-Vi53]|uniref:hypothetical protein n=1 Tax=Chryseobacterium sp. MMS23-Vi53 TaxID=3386644 RepID=UPI0039EB1D2A
MKDSMLNKLKSDYEELEIKPSSDLWDRLDQKLDITPEIVLKRSFQWWKCAAVLLLLISVGMIIYINSNKRKFDYKNADYVVKKRLEKTINPINPEFENQNVVSDKYLIEKEEVRLAVENKNSKLKEVVKEEKKEIIQPQISEFKTQEIAIQQPENIEVKPIKIENNIPNSPVIAEVKKTKATYINANELLLGREFDKTRENSYKNDVKFGVFNFNKPKIENVTVLGVTIVDSK